jgi:hypothetical protein
MYPYTTPPGMGDSFYIYSVNGEDIPLVDGDNYSLVGVTVEDADFIWRAWSGAALLLGDGGTVQLYDGARNAFFQLPVLQTNFPPAMAVLPEKRFRNNTALRFDLENVELNTNSNGTASVYADQMAWYGVKRSPGGIHDPAQSLYRYYEKPFSYPLTIQLNNYGPSAVGGAAIPGLATPTQYTQLVTDYDFELCRIIMSAADTTGITTALHVFSTEQGPLTVTAKTPGASGNSISIQFINNGDSNPASVLVAGDAITVTMGPYVDDKAALVAYLNAIPAVAALVIVTQAGGGGFQAEPITFLTGGGGSPGGVSPYASPFKITLYDAAWRSRSSIPLLAELICTNLNSASPPSTAPNNAWPCPPLLYPVNSVIRFDIYSLIPNGDALPVAITLLFDGVRRIAC